MKKLLLFLILLFVVIGATYILTDRFSLFQQQSSRKITTPKSEIAMKDAKIIGWTSYWDEQATLDTLEIHMKDLDVFSPILYQISSDGTLEPLTVNNKNVVLNLARRNNIPVVPVIGDDFDYERVKRLLSDIKVQDAFIDKLIEEAKKENYSGWSIDIETLKSSDKDAFSTFVKNTAEKLNKNDLELTMILYAKDENEKLGEALAQDYTEIGRYANHIVLMAYGYHNSSTSPGGQAPLDWYRSVLSYITQSVSVEKIGMGLTAHGYDWQSDKDVEAYKYSQIKSMIDEHNAKVLYDKDASSQITEFREDNIKHTIWYEDAKTIAEKMEIAMQEYGVTTFAIWRISAEDPKIWDTLAAK